MDETKMMAFVENAVGDVGALLGGAMVVIGDKLGLYRAMAGAGWLSPAAALKRAADAGLADRVRFEVGAAYYGFSTLLCTPSSLSQDVGAALGAQAGEARLREIVIGAGFETLHRVAETPFNIVLEARAS
jgi:hypothetical protein